MKQNGKEQEGEKKLRKCANKKDERKVEVIRKKLEGKT
jgi:hypothetical protein